MKTLKTVPPPVIVQLFSSSCRDATLKTLKMAAIHTNLKVFRASSAIALPGDNFENSEHGGPTFSLPWSELETLRTLKLKVQPCHRNFQNPVSFESFAAYPWQGCIDERPDTGPNPTHTMFNVFRVSYLTIGRVTTLNTLKMAA